MEIITGKTTEILRDIARPIEKVTPDIQKLIPEMRKTMKENHGIGLAAPQIGLSIRLFIAEPHYTKTEPGKLYVCINPEITARSPETNEVEESCLSLPGLIGTSTRHAAVTLSYTNEYGRKIKTKAKGLLAWIFQHELDHLNGILFIDHAQNVHERESKKTVQPT